MQVEQRGNFEETVTLGASGGPAGSTITFSVNDLPPPYVSVMTVSDIVGGSPGDYTIEITLDQPISPVLFFPKVADYAGGFIVCKQAVEALGNAAIKEWGRVDIWVNNAARLMVKPLIETTDDDWHGLLAANLHGFFYGSRAAARVARRVARRPTQIATKPARPPMRGEAASMTSTALTM